MVIRFILPALAIVIVARCVRSLLREKSEAENWGYLSLPNGSRIYLNHWENVIGRAKTSDVYMEYPTLSRNHAAVIRDDKANWRIYDVESTTGVIVNGEKVEDSGGIPVKTGDVISLGGVDLVFIAADRASEYEQASKRTRPGRIFRQRTTLIFLTEFQLLLGLQLCISKGETLTVTLPLCFLALITLTWICYFITRAIRRVAFEIETLGFFLCTIGMSITASSSVSDLFKQMMLLVAGVGLFFLIGGFLRDLDRAKKMRLPISAAGLLLLAVNLVFGRTVYGARNWMSIAGVTFQPAEFVKIAFVFAGAATLERLFTRRNLITFIAFTGICLIALALINDFGMALIFFVAYLVIAFLRSGDFATIFLSVGGAGFAGILALQFRSHIAGRFATWGKAWEFANAAGYQQTRAMVAAADGGLFGAGAGNGWFKHVFAADTDLVFCMSCEELGFIIALTAVCSIMVFAIFSVWSAGMSRSSFYVIGACAASSMLVFQMLMNVLGSVDLLPFTGVTFPFISKGGSSLMSCWGLLGFIKAADTRQNASFVVKTPKLSRKDDKQSLFEFPEDPDE
jgi:cell division protein FtsW (lipid II flippase)